MLVLHVQFLCRLYHGSTDRMNVEWPPHPARVFSALAAAHFSVAPEAAFALEWLEQQRPPAMRFDAAGDTVRWTQYVASNDPAPPHNSAPDAHSLLSRRKRIDLDAVAAPVDGCSVRYAWEVDPPGPVLAQLQRLASCVSYVGTSDDRAVLRFSVGEAGRPTLVPSAFGSPVVRIRVAAPGDLSRLRSSFKQCWLERPANKKNGKPVLGHSVMELRRVILDTPCLYSPPLPAQAEMGSDYIALWIEGRMALQDSLAVARAVRDGLMAHWPVEPPPWVTGHAPEGGRLRGSHLSVVPVPFVGHPRADGHLLGVWLLLPDGCDDRANLLHAVGGLAAAGLRLGGSGRAVGVRIVDTIAGTLNPMRWSGPAHRWASVTPVVYAGFPKDDGVRRKLIARMCSHGGLPEPVAATVRKDSAVPGAGGWMPPYKDFFHEHIELEFDEPVRGPVVLGRGRYRGYGLMLPVG